MKTLVAVSTAGVLATVLCAPLLRGRNFLLVLVPALTIALFTRVLWLFGLYARVVPTSLEDVPLMPGAAPVAMTLLYGGWLVARVRSKANAPAAIWARRLLLAGVVAVAATIVVAGLIGNEVIRGGWRGLGDASPLYALLLMLIPPLVSYAKDRDAGLAFFLTGFALVATIPVVIAGRLAYVTLAKVLYEVVS